LRETRCLARVTPTARFQENPPLFTSAKVRPSKSQELREPSGCFLEWCARGGQEAGSGTGKSLIGQVMRANPAASVLNYTSRVGALDRLADFWRAMRMGALVVLLTIVVGSAWAIRPPTVVGSAIASQARTTDNSTTSAAYLAYIDSLPCLVPEGFRAYRGPDGYIVIDPVSPIPNGRGMVDTRVMHCNPDLPNVHSVVLNVSPAP
jgi:hypothetical protein